MFLQIEVNFHSQDSLAEETFSEDFMIDFILFSDSSVLECRLHLQINNCFRDSCFIDHFICAQSREVEH